MNNPKRLAEILLEHICAQEYGKSEKVFEQHKAELEAMLKNWDLYTLPPHGHFGGLS